MALNFQTALDIGWDPPFDLLAVVDELYVQSYSRGSSSPNESEAGPGEASP
jgi:hypothetical protein